MPHKKLGEPDSKEGGEEEVKTEEISPDNMKYAEPLIPVFGEDVIKKMFSNKWTIREEGLKACDDYVSKNGDD